MDDEGLVEEVRACLAALAPDGVEKRMFSGRGFMVDGHLAVFVRGAHLLLRVPAADADALLALPYAGVPVMGERTMTGWLEVDTGGLDEDAVAGWVHRGVAHARTLPPPRRRERRSAQAPGGSSG